MMHNIKRRINSFEELIDVIFEENNHFDVDLIHRASDIWGIYFKENESGGYRKKVYDVYEYSSIPVKYPCIMVASFGDFNYNYDSFVNYVYLDDFADFAIDDIINVESKLTNFEVTNKISDEKEDIIELIYLPNADDDSNVKIWSVSNELLYDLKNLLVRLK